MPCEPKPLGTCFFGDNPEPLRIHHLMRNCEIGHESTEIVAWVENFRASIDHGGRKKKFTIRFRASFVRLFANSRLSLSRSRSPSFKSLSRHSTHIARRETQSTDSENGLKVRSPVCKVVRHDHEFLLLISFMALTRLINLWYVRTKLACHNRVLSRFCNALEAVLWLAKRLSYTG